MWELIYVQGANKTGLFCCVIHKLEDCGAEELTQWLRAHTALTEDLSSVSCVYVGRLITLYLQHCGV